MYAYINVYKDMHIYTHATLDDYNSLDLNSIGDAGACDLVDCLKANASITIRYYLSIINYYLHCMHVFIIHSYMDIHSHELNHISPSLSFSLSVSLSLQC